MDSEILRRLRSVNPSEMAEELLGVKLLWYQKEFIDIMYKSRLHKLEGRTTQRTVESENEVIGMIIKILYYDED